MGVPEDIPARRRPVERAEVAPTAGRPAPEGRTAGAGRTAEAPAAQTAEALAVLEAGSPGTPSFRGRGAHGDILSFDIYPVNWMALVHGAAGIQYFCHRLTLTFSETDCIDDSTRATALGGINAEVTGLAPVLNTQSVANGVTVSSSVAATPIDTMLKRQG